VKKHDRRKKAGTGGSSHHRAWEYGANWPSAFHLAKLATVLGVSIEELYLGPDPEGGPT
jgi:hypothetical protein